MRDALEETFEYYKDSGRHLMVDAALHRSQGVCVWSPELVLMARPVDSFDDPERVIDPFVQYDPSVCDGWHVHFMAGTGNLRVLRDLERVIHLFPWVTFERYAKGRAGIRRMGQRYYSLLFR